MNDLNVADGQTDDSLCRLQQPSPAEQQQPVVSDAAKRRRRRPIPPDLLLPRPRSAGTRSEPGRARGKEAEQPPELDAAQKGQVPRAASTTATASLRGTKISLNL